ncbi:MAG: hypothetical protein WB681_00640 [Candidatus Cybelea sp.]
MKEPTINLHQTFVPSRITGGSVWQGSVQPGLSHQKRREILAAKAAYAVYRRSLLDTFGAEYVDHVERWLAADGIEIQSVFDVNKN